MSICPFFGVSSVKRRNQLLIFLSCLNILVLLSQPFTALANNMAAAVMGVPGLRSYNQGLNGLGLTGKGQVVAVADAGLDGGSMDTLHPDLKDRVVGVKDFSGDGWADPNGHGTHIAGSIVGTGLKSQGLVKGMAPEAGLYFQATYNDKDKNLHIPSVYDLLLDAYNAPGKPRIHVNSWGANFSDGIYDWAAYSLDKFVWEHPDMLVLKSAGNGYKTAKPFVSSPGAAKNALTVGATEGNRLVDSTTGNPGQVTGFSSRGTFDGRIKPEVVAPGTWILSTRKSNPDLAGDGYIGLYNQYYGYMSGTSMSTALTAGAVTLLRQYLVQKGLSPSAALLKAALIFGASPLPGVSSLDQGFGRVNVESSLLALDKGGARYGDNPGIKTGDKVTYTYVSNGQPFKAVLAYTDYPKTPGTGKDLVNDLDLKVIGPNGQEVYWGNGYIDGDRLNNTEEITIDEPKQGQTYTIEVSGYKVEHGPQPFALVYGALPYEGTISSATGDEVKFTDGKTVKITDNTGIRVVNDDTVVKNAQLKDIPAGAEGYLVFGPEGQPVHLDALYTTLSSKIQSKENNNQLVIWDGTRWALADGARIVVGHNEIKWSELPIESEVTLTLNPVSGEIWGINVQSMPDNSAFYPLPLTADEVKQAIQNSRSSGKVVLSAPAAREEDKPVTLAFSTDMAAAIAENGRPVELRLPGFTLAVPAAEFSRIGQSEQGAQLQIRVSWQSVGDQPLPAVDPLMYLRPVGQIVEVRSAIVWPDGSQLIISQSKNPVRVTVTSPLGATAGINLKRLGIYRLNELTGQWELLGNDYNPDTGKAEVVVNRLGKFAILEASRTFADISGHWARTDIEIMAARGIVRGMTPQLFAPDDTVTRGQFTAMLVRTLGLTGDARGVKFTDLPADYWCAADVAVAVKAGLVSGYGNGLFGPNDPITREQMAAMLVRALNYGTIKPLPESTLKPGQFADQENISNWARTSVATIVQAGLMKGREQDMFAPQGLTTRAEAAAVMVRLLDYRGNHR